jgi:hypothetical protein
MDACIQSVMESFHGSLTFKLMSQAHANLNIIENLERDERKLFRSTVITLILETDMSRHFDAISTFRIRRQSPDFRTKAEDNTAIMRLCIKAADIGHAAKAWDLHREWSLRVVTEFFNQVCTL